MALTLVALSRQTPDSSYALRVGRPRLRRTIARNRLITALSRNRFAGEAKRISPFVSTQPCLVCQRLPCDAHHLKFAPLQAMGRKVSDEFTVPVCREHHHELHRNGNEAAWWANLQIAPVEIARELWRVSPIHGEPIGPEFGAAPPNTESKTRF